MRRSRAIPKTATVALAMLFIASFAQAAEVPERAQPPVNTAVDTPAITSGSTIDLSSWNPEERVQPLDGQWDVWWNLVSDAPQGPPHKVVPIPSKWVNPDHAPPESTTPGTGHATYQVTLTGLPDDVSNLAIFIRTLGLAYRLTVTDQTGHKELLLKAGKVGTSLETSIAREIPLIGNLSRFTGPELTLTIEISNYQYDHGGPWRAPVIGTQDELNYSFLVERFSDFALFGVLLVVAIYHLLLYIVRHEDRISLAFFIFCSVMLARHITTQKFLELLVLPEVNWAYIIRNKLEFLALFLIPVSFANFLHRISDKICSRKELLFNVAVASVFCLSVLGPPRFYSALLSPFHVYIVIFLTTTLYKITREAYRKSFEARIQLLAVSILFPVSCHDILLVHLQSNRPFLASYGLIIYVFIQSYMIARMFAQAHRRSSDLARALVDEIETRRGIEGELSEVTSKLDAARTELKDSEKLLMQAQKLASIGELVASIGHELKNPLQTLSLQTDERRDATGSISNFCDELFDDSPEAKEAKSFLDKNFAKLEDVMARDTIAIERMKDISMALNRSGRIDHDPVESPLKSIIHDALVLVSGKTKMRTLTYDLTKNDDIWCHPSHIGQVFTNLLSNASDALEESHGHDGGNLKIRTTAHEYNDVAGIMITVEDDGPGVPQNIREKILQPFFTTKAAGVGTGLGLAISSRIIKAHGGSITIGQSEELGGALFSIWLPLDFRSEMGLNPETEAVTPAAGRQHNRPQSSVPRPLRSPAEK